jgi:RND superfamily putative drug exporter
MFQKLGNLVVRAWPAVLLFWLAVLFVSHWLAPPWNEVAQDKEFGFLPARSPSLVAEEEFKKAFPEERVGSSIVLVLTNPGGARDVQVGKDFISDVLEPDLRKIAESEGGLTAEPPVSEDSDPFAAAPPASPKPAQPNSIIDRIRTPNAPGTGALLESKDGKALLVAMELNSEFLSKGNWRLIQKVENLIQELKDGNKLPAGMDLVITGSAVLGRDFSKAEVEGSKATEWLTIVMVIGLLILIYRAPLLALIPLVTVFVSAKVSLNVLSILAAHGYLTLFQGIQVFITVLAYGAGVDYCLFLMARYKEELDQGHSVDEAVRGSIGSVGAALAASAATVICGIGMMYFAEFGKFQQAGVAIPFALTITLAATLTFSAALLRLAGPWAFWPHMPKVGSTRAAQAALEPAPSFLQRLTQPSDLHKSWEWIGRRLLRHPGKIWTASVAVMLPFAIVGIIVAGQLAYDLVGNLPSNAPSVTGVKVLREHFPEGILGPVVVLILNDKVDFDSAEGREVVTHLTDQLQQKMGDLHLADIRSLTKPLGIHVSTAEALAKVEGSEEQRQRVFREQSLQRYATDLGGRKRVGTRLDLVFDQNPFSRESVDDLDRLDATLRDSLPERLRDGSQIFTLGPTASIRDLGNIHESDHTRICVLVVAAVFLILMLLLRAPIVSLYMITSVLFSYYVTIGIAYLVFWAFSPHPFPGLDWKVSTFLFTILIAVGEDYNIFLMARVHEEQEKRGKFRGILCALTRTGPIISSCGIIMAGTFISLMAGTLTEMKQLGFALALGVLVDTFVVRPILVPAFLMMLEKWRHRGNAKAAVAEVATSKVCT